MKQLAVVLVAALAALPATGIAQPDVKVDVTRAPGQTMATGVAKTTATITAIDAPSRKVTLKSKTGKVIEMTVGEEARNFDQLRVGDLVTAEYQEALTLSLKKGGGETSRQERQIEERAAPGAKPGGRMGREVTIMAQVVAVNPEARIVTVKGPKGNVVDLMVEDPEQMKGIKKGDRIQAVYTEALAIAVTPAAK